VEKSVRVRQATHHSMMHACMHAACWIAKATNAYFEYVILFAFPRQNWLHKCALVLCYTYIACHVDVVNKWALPVCWYSFECGNCSGIICITIVITVE